MNFNKQSIRYWSRTFICKRPIRSKYQYLINKCEKVGLKHCDDPEAFIEYSNDMQNV